MPVTCQETFTAGLSVRIVKRLSCDLAPDDRRARQGATDDRQLVAEVAVERLEVRRQLDGREALAVGGDVAVVDVHHVRRLDEGVLQVLVRRIERVVDLERAAALGERAVDGDVALEVAGVAVRAVAVDADAVGALAEDAASARALAVDAVVARALAEDAIPARALAVDAVIALGCSRRRRCSLLEPSNRRSRAPVA